MRLGPVGRSEDGAGAQLQPLSAKPQPLTTAPSLLWGGGFAPIPQPQPRAGSPGAPLHPQSPAQRGHGAGSAGLGDIPGGN